MTFVGIYSCIIGTLGAIGGASKESRFYRVDDIICRVLGIAHVILGAGLLLHKHWALISLIIIYVISIVEAIITVRIREWFGFLCGIMLFLGLPLIYLILFLSSQTW